MQSFTLNRNIHVHRVTHETFYLLFHFPVVLELTVEKYNYEQARLHSRAVVT